MRWKISDVSGFVSPHSVQARTVDDAQGLPTRGTRVKAGDTSWPMTVKPFRHRWPSAHGDLGCQ